MTASPDQYTTRVAPAWIDYNGHLRDGYYTVVFSCAIDALMDRLGLDEAYRRATHCTLYTLELHVHFLHEVTATDELTVRWRVLDADHKRLHVALEMYSAQRPAPAASAEFMLLHVRQGEAPAAAEFPAEIAAAIEALRVAAAANPEVSPGSRKIGLRRH